MAGELRGALLEALLLNAVKPLATRRGYSISYGRMRPKMLSVTPDILISDQKGHPQVLFLVTASDSSSDANRKFWRNFIEIAEAKHLDPAPLVIDLTVELVEKDLYENVRAAVFDACIRLPAQIKTSFFNLLAVVEKALNAKATIDDCLAVIEKLPANHRSAASLIVATIRAQAEKAFRGGVNDGANLWAATKRIISDRKFRAPVGRTTSFTRGVAKLLLFHKDERKDVLASIYSKRRMKSFPDELVSVDLAKKTIGGFVITDSDILGAVSLVSCDRIEQIIANTDPAKYATYVSQIRQIGEHDKACRFILERNEFLSNARNIESVLQEVYDGDTITGFGPPIGYHWLFDGLISLYRAANKGEMAGFYNEIEKATGIAKSVQRFHYPRFIRFEAELPTELLKAASRKFARFIKVSDPHALLECLTKIKDSVLQNLLECKLIQHGIRPLQQLFELAYHTNTGTSIAPVAISSSLSDQDYFLSTEGYQIGKVIVITKSVTEKGRMHKVKELKSKVLQLRVARLKSGGFCENDDVKKLFMLVDGTFSDADFIELGNVGVDGFFYPDAVDELVYFVNNPGEFTPTTK
jgi:hypothetical protein